jgi:arsenate reductase
MPGRAICIILAFPITRAEAIDMDVTIYHNPRCGSSRNTLALIRAAGVEPHIIDYLANPPTRAELAALAARAAQSGLTARALVRSKEALYTELGLDDAARGDEALLDALAAHPILINRPLVVTPKGVRVCRPPELVHDIL